MILCERCGGPIRLSGARAPLTKRQYELLEYVKRFLASAGYAPSLKEIAAHLQLRSLSTVYEHLHTLERKGYVVRGYNESRSIALVEVPA